MKNNNALKPATELTKLEYALIHSTWFPNKEDIDSEYNRDRILNPHNDYDKPKIRSISEIIKDLKIKYLSDLLAIENEN